jgi:pimeloyl-ACP methyl ester carboxylesterase
MRAREPDAEGYADRGGTKLHYEVFGDGAPTLLLLPCWTIIHTRFWKAQVPYLARHFRVVTYDGPGNGRSDRPLDPAPYHHDAEGASALAVLDATGTERAVLVSLSMGAEWALWLTAHAPERVLGNVFIGPSLDLDAGRGELDDPPFDEPYTSTRGWAKYNRYYWLDHWEDFVAFFFARCFPEPHSTKPIEDCLGWGLETTPQVMLAMEDAPRADEAAVRGWLGRSRRPTLVIHGSKDEISPARIGAALARETGGQLVVVEGAGHIPLARDPVKVNLLLREFVESLPDGRRR